MAIDGREIRLQRLLGDGRGVIIAMDHGMFDGPIDGLIDATETAEKINPCVDAVLLAPGMLRYCNAPFTRPKRPLAVVRLNWNTVYCSKYGYTKSKSVDCYDVASALREGMDIALVSLTLQTGDECRDAANVEIFCRALTACHELGIPVIGEYFPKGHLKKSAEELHEDVYNGVRIITELGADAVKTFHTKDFKAVAASCPVPILALGAEKLPTQRDALNLAAREVADGAGGVVFGRNAIQVENPHAFQAALCDIVKHQESVDNAMNKHRLS